jgi:dolichol-phosphate mannosyltransferase
MSIFIVIPTYNEKNNIEKVISKLLDLKLEHLRILVVDDNSPDGTGGIVETIKKNNPAVDILHRSTKAGLGPAYVAGFRQALQQGADYIFAMDADMSHDPKYIPAMLTAAAKADLVLGSRYITGGQVLHWGMWRRLVSRFGNVYARLILGLPYHDLTGGFKCYSRTALTSLDLDGLNSLGYNFQIETTYHTHLAGFTIKELPITFTERTEGKSKFNLGIMLEGFWGVLELRFKKKRT